MGVFSLTCAKTHLPVLYSDMWRKDAPRLTRVAVLVQGEEVRENVEYDGYGLRMGADFDKAKLVLQSDYAGETFEELGLSRHEPGQGYFHSLPFILEVAKCPGFPTYDAYHDAFDDFETRADAVSLQVLTELGYPVDDSNAYSLAALMDSAATGDTQALQKAVERSDHWKTVLLDALREDGPEYLRLYGERTAAVAHEIVARAATQGEAQLRTVRLLEGVQAQVLKLSEGSGDERAAGLALQSLLKDWQAAHAAGDFDVRRIHASLAGVSAALSGVVKTLL